MAEPLHYLDHAATTPLLPEAADAMAEAYEAGLWANPSGGHLLARRARRAADDARDELAELFGAQPAEVVFTSGGTEADNLAVLGTIGPGGPREGAAVLSSAIEHPAVREPARRLGGSEVAVDEVGRVDLEALAAACTPEVGLVSVMLVNNEIGTIADLDAVAQVVRRRAKAAVLHTDAVQAHQWLEVGPSAAAADLVSIGAHKFGGPKGIGLLVVRGGVELAARAVGGGQERDRRAGTLNVAGVLGMAAAARATAQRRDAEVPRIAALRDRLADGLAAAIPNLIETGVSAGPDGRPDRSTKVAGNCHVCLPGVETEALLYLLEREGIMATAASSCASGAQEPSYVVNALGLDRRAAAGALRLTLGVTTTQDDVDVALATIPAAVERLALFS
ncbi:MAG: cysteine desulfurase family protein [Microthrixaceae bacterium]